MHSMMVSKRYPRLLRSQIIGTCLHSLDKRDSPSKFRVSTPALLYKVLPQSYQDGQYICMIVVWVGVDGDRLDSEIRYNSVTLPPDR